MWFLYVGHMTNRENESQVQLNWTSKAEWASWPRTYRAAITVDGVEWSFVVDSPYKGQWRLRGWEDDRFAIYRTGTRMKDMKSWVQGWINDEAEVGNDV